MLRRCNDGSKEITIEAVKTVAIQYVIGVLMSSSHNIPSWAAELKPIDLPAQELMVQVGCKRQAVALLFNWKTLVSMYLA